MTTEKKFKQLSLTQAGQFDSLTGQKGKLTGWARVCKARTNDNSKSQRRKRARKG